MPSKSNPKHQKHKFSYENPLLARFGEDYFKNLPQVPGVYFMLGADGEILYIGKAKSLRSRLRQYSNAKPGSAAERTLELLDNVVRLEFHTFESDEQARSRELELLHAIRPPFNIADTWEENYLFIGTRTTGRKHFDFQLSSASEIIRDGYRVYGCFQHRPRVKSGYTALMRLFWAVTHEGRHFSYPSRITRTSPPWLYASRLPVGAGWEDPLQRFLSGESEEPLLHKIIERLLHNESIPAFMHPSLQDDIELVRRFFRLGPAQTLQLRQRHGLTRSRVISHSKMDSLIRASVNFAPTPPRSA